jgi:ATP-dependent Lon protease
MILDSVVEANPQLLSTGIWGVATIRHAAPLLDERENKLTLSMLIENFNPFHASNIDMKGFLDNREKFTTEEWMDILINTTGLNPEVYTRRQKLLLITRFIPVVENNINVLELGPRATGKTYFYRNMSFYTRIISGGRITPAQLFYHITRKTVGEIGLKDVLVFDEIGKLKFSNPNEMMGKLKDYMVDGHFERGPKKGTSLCSLVFMGNIDIKPGESGYIPIEDINYKLPDFMRGDSAFLDRIHGVLPGWEIAKIKKSEMHLCRNYGFSVDFFSEILHELRKIDFTPVMRSSVKLENVTIRDEIGIYRLAAGLAKILFPSKKFTYDDLKMIMDIVVEYRQKIADLLHKMAPGEFERKRIHYRVGANSKGTLEYWL